MPFAADHMAIIAVTEMIPMVQEYYALIQAKGMAEAYKEVLAK